MKKLLLRSSVFALLCFAILLVLQAQQRQFKVPGLQDTLLLNNYRPKSIFNTPKTEALKAKYAAIDMHMHAPRGGGDLNKAAAELLKNMDECNVEKTILFCGTGKAFDDLAAVFGKNPKRFELWCGFDYSGNFPSSTIAELERCVKLGAKGVGEISDKGQGYGGIKPPMHLDDSRMDPILEKLADLKLPINVHMGDPKWMYEPMDATNDLLFEALNFRLDDKPDRVNNEGMLAILDNAVKRHPRVTFVACHFANQTYDLDRLGKLLDKYPNLYADVSQRESYLAAVPRYAKRFMEKYADRLVWGTDQGYSLPMYRNSFHIWQTLDEHFYAWDVQNTRFALSGVGLSDTTLKKLYRDNQLRILKK
jgi:predicted TIM-barrel fold metal-dependent hydrolase